MRVVNGVEFSDCDSYASDVERRRDEEKLEEIAALKEFGLETYMDLEEEHRILRKQVLDRVRKGRAKRRARV